MQAHLSDLLTALLSFLSSASREFGSLIYLNSWISLPFFLRAFQRYFLLLVTDNLYARTYVHMSVCLSVCLCACLCAMPYNSFISSSSLRNPSSTLTLRLALLSTGFRPPLPFRGQLCGQGEQKGFRLLHFVCSLRMHAEHIFVHIRWAIPYLSEGRLDRYSPQLVCNTLPTKLILPVWNRFVNLRGYFTVLISYTQLLHTEL